MKRVWGLLALLFAALLGSAPVAALSTGQVLESAVVELDLGQARGSLEQRAEPGAVTPEADGAGAPEDAAASGTARFPVRAPRGDVHAAFAGRSAPDRLRSYQARAPPRG